jgi:hypothetical protein
MRIRIIFLLLLTTIVISCNSTNRRSASFMADEVAAPAPEMIQRSEKELPLQIERKIIRSGEIRFETDDLIKTESLISKAVSELKGYVSNDNLYNSDDRTTHRLVIRIPAENFDILLDRISENAQKIDSKTVDAQDVTEEYIDVESRMRTKKEIESRYKELLSQAKDVEDILSIEKEIGTLRTDIESVEGRMQYLQNQVAFSSLTVEFYQKTSSAFHFSSKAGQAIVMGWKWLLAFVIFLVHLWPFIIIGGIIIFTVKRIGKRKKVKSI